MERNLVLIVDDDPDLREALTVRLMTAGYSVIGARNALEAINLTLSHHPMLILLDLNLPDDDGFSVMEEFQRHETTRHIPIVIITAYGESWDIAKAYDPGVVRAFFAKPIDHKKLLRVIHAVETSAPV